MRYKIISTENLDGQVWPDQTIAGFSNRETAIKFARSLHFPCYVVDSFLGVKI
jgi:hypothetical protein